MFAQSDILTVRFSPNGRSIASGSKDKQIFLWNVYGDCQNYLAIKGHKHAILDLVWTNDSEYVVIIMPYIKNIYLFYY